MTQDTDPSASDGLGDIERRDYLQAVGGAGVAGLVGSAASGSAAAQSGDWESQADQAIQENRTGQLEVEVVDGSGQAVSGAEVSVEMQDHDFGFGTAVNANTFANSSEGDPYRENIKELFNTAVLENRHKWKFFENDQERAKADETTQWLDDHGFSIRGHVCVWGRTDVNAIPNDVLQAANNGDAQTIRDRTMQHIRDVITHYGDQIDEWEVVNEALHVWKIQKGVYGDQINDSEQWKGEVKPWASELLADWYSEAQSVIEENGLDIGLGVNDFNTMAYSYPRTWYPTEIEHLESSGIDLDAIGHQCHIAARSGEPVTDNNPDGRLSYDAIMTNFDNYADYDASQRVTEFDMYQGNQWSGQEERARILKRYLKAAYSHPDVEDFLLWGFWDGRHWQSEAPLFEQDWSEKPAYDVWTGLVHDEWWTSESGTTGSSGTYSTDAFLGTHDVTVTTDQGSTTKTVEVTDASAGASVQVSVSGDGTTPEPGCSGDGGPPAWPDGTQPCDPDGDDVWEDFNGNERVDSDDVVVYFENYDEPYMADNVEFYDINDNGRTDSDDVVRLFESL